VHGREPAGDLQRELDAHTQGHLLVDPTHGVAQLSQGDAVDVLHGQVRTLVVLASLQHPQQVGMFYIADQKRFVLQRGACTGITHEVGMQALHREEPTAGVRASDGDVHSAHASAGDLDEMPVGEGVSTL